MNPKHLLTLLASEGLLKTASAATPRPMDDIDWEAFAGAEKFHDGNPPWILEFEGFKGNIADRYEFSYKGDPIGRNVQSAVVIADANGVVIHFTSKGGDQGPMFEKGDRLESSEAKDALKSVARFLAMGKVPPSFQHIN